MRKIVLIFIFFAVLLATTLQGQHQTLEEKMTSIDRSLIHALYDAHTGDLKAAKNSVTTVANRWEIFNLRYRNYQKNNEDWTESFRKATEWLEDARMAIKDGDKYDSFILLDHFRYELILIRFRMENYDYFIDDLWDLEAVIDIMSETSASMDLCCLESCEFDELIIETNLLWHKINAHMPNLKTFSLSRKNMDSLILQKQHLGEAIINLNHLNMYSDSDKLKSAIKDLSFQYWEFARLLGI